jgi:hypothetical protein
MAICPKFVSGPESSWYELSSALSAWRRTTQDAESRRVFAKALWNVLKWDVIPPGVAKVAYLGEAVTSHQPLRWRAVQRMGPTFSPYTVWYPEHDGMTDDSVYREAVLDLNDKATYSLILDYLEDYGISGSALYDSLPNQIADSRGKHNIGESK